MSHIWLNNSPIPKEVCEREASLKDYGIYRRLNDGRFEFVSYCEPIAKDFFQMHKDDFERILNDPDEAKKVIEIMK